MQLQAQNNIKNYFQIKKNPNNKPKTKQKNPQKLHKGRIKTWRPEISRAQTTQSSL